MDLIFKSNQILDLDLREVLFLGGGPGRDCSVRIFNVKLGNMKIV